MLTLIIGTIGIVLIIVTIANSAWLELGIVVVILLFLITASANERDDWKAYVNCREYLKQSGKERAKSRILWEESALREIRRDRVRAEERKRRRNDRKVEEAIQRIRAEYATREQEE